MYQTAYHRPKSLAEAARLFAELGDCAYLSGGHTLLPTMKGRLASPEHLIDLRHVPEIKGIALAADGVSIGAATTHAEIAASEEVKRALPTLAGLAGSIGDPHVRHLGTIGGSVANNDPAADYPSAVLALRGIVHTDRRAIAADAFFSGLYTTALEEGEIVTRIVLRVPEASAYAKFRNPASRYAMAASFIARHADGEVRVAITGAGNDGVFRWREAEDALARRFSSDVLDELALDPSNMMGDMHGAPDYRAHLAAIMTRRAVENIGQVLIVP